jgi:rRNA-processing protein FCF1
MTTNVLPSAVVTNDVKILIDTNMYLDFYRSNKDAIKLLGELSKHFDKIILTDQIIQEFERNREVVIKTLKKNFEFESKLENFSSAYLKNLAVFNELLLLQKDYELKRKEVISAIDNILINPEHDLVFNFFSELVSDSQKNNRILGTTEDIIKKAHARKLVGNPPTSDSYSIGDEINWEIVLENVTENIILVGRDNTYTKNFSFLKRDFHRHTGRLVVKLTNSITEALNEIGIQTEAELVEIEKEMIKELKIYNEYWKHVSGRNFNKDDGSQEIDN